MPFRDHLCTHQNVEILLAKALQNGFVMVLTAYGIAVTGTMLTSVSMATS